MLRNERSLDGVRCIVTTFFSALRSCDVPRTRRKWKLCLLLLALPTYTHTTIRTAMTLLFQSDHNDSPMRRVT